MITINIEQTQDSDKKGEYSFYKNLVYIGRDPGSDLFLDDPNLNLNHLFIEVIDTKILCHLSKNTSFILINGKRTTGYKEIKVGDKIKVGNSTFSLISAVAINETSYREQLNNITEKILSEAPELVGILKDIQKSGE